jgi:hypothetical protein
MRTLLFLACCGLAACATRNEAPPPVQVAASETLHVDADEARRACLDRMANARSRGAAHWMLYEHCLKEPH